jgi:hypothetical protein
MTTPAIPTARGGEFLIDLAMFACVGAACMVIGAETMRKTYAQALAEAREDVEQTAAEVRATMWSVGATGIGLERDFFGATAPVQEGQAATEEPTAPMPRQKRRRPVAGQSPADPAE